MSSNHLSNRIFLRNISALSIVLFVIYSAFPLLRYVFYPIFLINLIWSFIVFLKISKKANFFSDIFIYNKEFLVLALFFVFGLLFSRYNYDVSNKDLIKLIESVAFLSIIFVLHANKCLKNIYIDILKIFIFISVFFGIVNLLVFSLISLDINWEILNFFKSKTTLISFFADRNFYSLVFLISIIALRFLNYNKLILKINLRNFFYNSVFTLNIILTFSRRGYFVFLLILIILFLYSFIVKKKYKTLLFLSIIALLLSILIVHFNHNRNNIIKNKDSQIVISSNVYKIYASIEPEINYSYIDNLLWNNIKENDNGNLIYNGNFTEGLTNWKKTLNKNDSASVEIISSVFGNAARVKRIKGYGWFPLNYQGRAICYYKDLTYTWRFKYRIIKTNTKKMPFSIGWWTLDGGIHPDNLEVISQHIKDDWFQGECTYTFKENQFKLMPTFLSVKQGCTIDITDISLHSNDTLERPCYVDMRISKYKEQPSDIFIGQRTSRWSFAWNYFINYSVLQKVFGGGFDYLTDFGKHFLKYSNKLDYPHNPIISSFLYSGILGGFFYIYFLIMTFFYYWKYRKYHFLFFIMYLITFFFMFFSGNSHFSVPIFTMLSIVPFITRYLVKTNQFYGTKY